MCSAFKCFVNGNLYIAKVVEGIKNSDNINAVFNALSDEGSYNIIGIMLVSEKVLSAKEHL